MAFARSTAFFAAIGQGHSESREPLRGLEAFRMTIDGLPAAMLRGENEETLSLQVVSESSLQYDSVYVQFESPNSILNVSQHLETGVYQLDLHGIASLHALVAGDSEASFQFSALRFNLAIYEHTWGVRSAFICEACFSSIAQEDEFPWPRHRPIGDHLLDDRGVAVCLQAAFTCGAESLASFAKQLDRVYW